MPKLRGHHLICLHFFNGMGYDEEFIKELKRTIVRTSQEPVDVVAGPDDVCKRCPHLREGRCAYTTGADEEITFMDGEALRLLGLSSGSSVQWQDLRHSIQRVFSRWHEAYCTDCDWRSACEESPRFKDLSGGIDGS